MPIENNPYQAPDANLDAPQYSYQGISRAFFFFASFFGFVLLNMFFRWLTIVFMYFVTSPPNNAETGELVEFVFMFFYITPIVGLFVTLAIYRYKNMGYNPWWGLLILIPLFNGLVYIQCLIYPTNYSDSNKIDLTGKIIAIAFVIFFALLMMMLSTIL
ncbi:hypothetical protein [Candidatus Albibeggiatoa sp. nov. NOAA]|uniref:hypothetical protein n=1 Tax=Candidatus Albibeggiatoa sp. nov. NOAA TaxID=3162724 RepID=UPI003304BFD0|nr:hypothetical protein [Thiotrichaceae bacterium]